jgi:membrane protease YdiL (CAAX protease family)
MVHSAWRARGSVIAPYAAFVLITLGATTMVLALTTLTTRPDLAGLALFTPAPVAFALGAARRSDLRSIVGARPDPAVAVAALVSGPAVVTAVLGFTDTSLTMRWPGLLPFALAMGGAVSGELGWRGYLHPLLRKRYPTLVSGLLTGLGWALWQIPFVLAGANQLPGVGILDMTGWALASGIAFTALLEPEPRSTWLPIALQIGFTLSFAMSSILPEAAGSPTPFRLASSWVGLIGVLLLGTLRRRRIKGRHRQR